jgi:hypothetical protein
MTIEEKSVPLAIPAIETKYKGYNFRSRLEARWAVFFDALEIPWQYELEGYDLGVHGKYLPDFFLPTVYLRSMKSKGVWLEIKPIFPEDEVEKFQELGNVTGIPVAIAVGMPMIGGCGVDPSESQLYQISPWWDNCMQWMCCPACCAVKIEYAESNYEFCPECACPTRDGDWRVRLSIDAARGARFEHGESGIMLTK